MHARGRLTAVALCLHVPAATTAPACLTAPSIRLWQSRVGDCPTIVVLGSPEQPTTSSLNRISRSLVSATLHRPSEALTANRHRGKETAQSRGQKTIARAKGQGTHCEGQQPPGSRGCSGRSGRSSSWGPLCSGLASPVALRAPQFRPHGCVLFLLAHPSIPLPNEPSSSCLDLSITTYRACYFTLPLPALKCTAWFRPLDFPTATSTTTAAFLASSIPLCHFIFHS